MDIDEATVITQKIFEVGHPEWADNLIDAIRRDQQYADRDVTLLAEHATEARQGKIWEVVFKDEPKTWERFCQEKLELPAEYIDAIIIGVDILKGTDYEGEISEGLAQRVARGARGATPSMTPEERAEYAVAIRELKRDNPNYLHYNYNVDSVKMQGTSADYLTRRIARDRPDILERMKAGEYRSVRQAAIDAGIVKPEKRITIPIDPERAARSIKRHFDEDQIEELIDLLQ